MAAGRALLSQVMGKAGADAASSGKLTLEHLPSLLGEGMPELPKNAVGRHRLIRALKQRFGDNFRSLPGVSDIVSHFDREIAGEVHLSKIRAVKLIRAAKEK